MTEATPLVPASCDLRDFAFMPLEVDRLRRSKQWLLAKRRPEIGFYSMNLWAASWHEVPAGSLEDDDDVLADVAMCDPRRWPKVKEDTMRGWLKCSDGRLYHPVVCEKARESWAAKIEQRQRTDAARLAKLRKRLEATEDEAEKKRLRKIVTDIELTLSNRATEIATDNVTDHVTRSATKSVTKSVTDIVTSSKGQGQGQGQGQKERKPATAIPLDSDPPDPLDDAGAVVADFEARRSRHWPTESGLTAPSQTLRTQAQQFLDAGGTPALISEVIDRGMTRAASIGKRAPTSLAAYGHSLTDAIASHRQAAIAGGNGHAPAAPPRSRNPVAGSPEEAAMLREMGLDP